MKQCTIAELVGVAPSYLTHLVGLGELPEYPDNYKKMSFNEIRDYVENCRKMLAQRKIERAKVDTRNRGDFRLPEIYRKYERGEYI